MDEYADLSCYIPEKQYRYWYSILDAGKKKIYIDLLNGFFQYKSSFPVWAESAEELQKVFHALSFDVPEAFFVKSLYMTQVSSQNTITVTPTYSIDYDTCRNLLNQMRIRTNSFLQRIRTDSDIVKIRKMHDEMIRLVSYEDLPHICCHEAPGPILYGTGVCEGIAKAFKYLADRVGLRSVFVPGEAEDGRKGDARGGHAWNIVYIGEIPYHLDVTFDLSLSDDGLIRYDYYLLSDQQISLDHVFHETPACPDSNEFYEEVSGRKSLKSLITRRLHPGTPVVFKVCGIDTITDPIKDIIMDAIDDVVEECFTGSYTLSMSCNAKRKIFKTEISV